MNASHTTVGRLLTKFKETAVFMTGKESLDLNTMDSFLWGHLKQLGYAVRLEDIDHLQSRIRDACLKINGDRKLLNRVYDNFQHRIGLCMTSSGEPFKHL